MSDPLRPGRPRPWSARLVDTLHASTPGRIAAGVASVFIGAIVVWWLLRAPSTPVEQSLPRAGAALTSLPPRTSPTEPAPIVVQAAGAVVHPGVYRLADGARVVDLLQLAGGPKTGADLDSVGLAAALTDGERVYVPLVGEAVVSLPAAAPARPLDLNSATVEQLDALPGVGPATAQAIVAHRAQIGRYTTVDQLLDVKGLGPAKVDALRALVRV